MFRSLYLSRWHAQRTHKERTKNVMKTKKKLEIIYHRALQRQTLISYLFFIRRFDFECLLNK